MLEEREILQKELERLKDKKNLLNEISIEKKEALKKIKEIDNILNDKVLLQEEYVKRNEKRPEYNKIFSLSHLEEILNKERRKMLSKIEENNKLMEPKFYVEVTKKIESDLELLCDIENDKEEQEKNKLTYIINLQKAFIKCFYTKIEKVTTKEEVINLLYMLRYYELIYITGQKQIKDVGTLKEELNQIEKLLIKKAYELKMINTITNEEEINNEIIKNILQTKIISLENIIIELKPNDQSLDVNIYDGDIFEKTITIREFRQKQIIAKFGKKMRVFN